MKTDTKGGLKGGLVGELKGRIGIIPNFTKKPALLLSPRKFIFYTEFLGFLGFMKDFEWRLTGDRCSISLSKIELIDINL